jgi:hypothetical protein
MNRPNPYPRKQTDDRVTYSPTATTELGLPCASRPLLATYAHPRMMPDPQRAERHQLGRVSG